MDPDSHLIVEPGKVVSRKGFGSYPSFSMAVDGYCADAPFYDPKGPRININHHENVDRLSTRSSAAQFYLDAKLGMFETAFTKGGKPHAFMYVNDCDEDVCLTSWLLFHYDQFKSTHSNPLLTRFMGVSDLMDSTSGIFPITPESSILEEMAWIYRPYREARMQKQVHNASSTQMRGIIYKVWENIDAYLAGKGGHVDLDTRLEYLYRGKEWAMIREIGKDARLGLLEDHIPAYVIFRGKTEKGNGYVIGKLSQFCDFPVEPLYGYLNSLEGKSVWGGGDVVGGCMREEQSRFSPKELEDIITDFLASAFLRKRFDKHHAHHWEVDLPLVPYSLHLDVHPARRYQLTLQKKH